MCFPFGMVFGYDFVVQYMSALFRAGMFLPDSDDAKLRNIVRRTVTVVGENSRCGQRFQ